MNLLLQKKNFVSTLIILSAFLFYFVMSLLIPIEHCPDEYMRLDIPLWIFKNHRLPVGNETELINPIWGYSYAFSPYLPSILSVFCMHIYSFFGGIEQKLYLSARFVSVFSGTGTVFLCLLIGKEIFKRAETKYLFAVLVGFLPQFFFLSTYHNNDSFSVFCTALIFLAWVRGIKNHWNLSSCVLLGVGTSLEALTYYFAYGWILCSVLLAVFSVFKDDKITSKAMFIASRSGVIFLIFGILALWYFARNFVIYEGDIFGMNTSAQCAEEYALEGFKPSMHKTLKLSGKSFISILIDIKWFFTTVRSFICVFGYMKFYTKNCIYLVYILIFMTGIASLFIHKSKEKTNMQKRLLHITLVLCIVIPYFISLYHSWAIDWEPQGRYVISALLPLMYFVSLGYERMAGRIEGVWQGKIIPVLITIYVFLFIIIFCTLGIGKLL